MISRAIGILVFVSLFSSSLLKAQTIVIEDWEAVGNYQIPAFFSGYAPFPTNYPLYMSILFTPFQITNGIGLFTNTDQMLRWELGQTIDEDAVLHVDLVRNDFVVPTLGLSIMDSTGARSSYSVGPKLGHYAIPFSDFVGSANILDIDKILVHGGPVYVPAGLGFDNLTIGFRGSDADLDGIEDYLDSCPQSDTRATLIIAGYDTGVENILNEEGCTLADLISDSLAAGASQADLVALALEWKRDGLISGREFGIIVSSLAATP